MPLVPIDLPDELCVRLLSCSPPLDVAAVCKAALLEALDKRANLEHTNQMSPNIEIQSQLPAAGATKRGRPPKGTVVDRRVYRSVGLAQATWDILEQTAKSSGLSVNDAIEALVLAAHKPLT